MARRYLQMSSAEWDRLAWWEQQMYLEGYEWEGLIEATVSGGSKDSTVTSTKTHQAADGSTVIDREHKATFSGLPGEMANFGFTEQTIG